MGKKLTNEEFIEKARKINPALKITSEYINAKTKINCECLECGKKISIQPFYIMSNGGHTCKDKIKPSKPCKTQEQFISELYKINQNINVIGKYTKALEKIDCECKICGNKWNPIASTLLRGQGCPKCAKQKSINKRKMHYDDFIRELNKINNNIIVIGNYVNAHTKVKCKCNICNNEWDAIPSSLLHVSGCPVCAINKNADNLRKTHEEYIDELIENNIPLRPLEQYITSGVSILHECILCGSKRKYTPNDVLRRKYCTICQGNDLVVEYGVNSLLDTHPQIAEMLEDKNNGKIYSYKSTHKCNFICPNCNSLVKNKQIQYVVKHGLPCPKCSDGISYPMKFVCCMFNQLNIKYDTEVIFENWNFMLHDQIYKPRYDIVFDNYIVEVDGELHKKRHPKSKLSIEDIRYIDKNKDELAYKNGYEMIRIDCCQSDINYICNSILSSKLNKIFDLSNINWVECHKYAISSKVKEVCDYWNSLEEPSVTKVFTDLNMPRITTQRWLKKGALAGMCNYNPYEEGKKYREKVYEQKRKSVICLNTKKVYDSLSCAAKETGANASSISYNCLGKYLSAGKDKNNQKLYWMYYEDYLREKEAI